MTNRAALSLSAMISQYFIGGMMPESPIPVQENATIIDRIAVKSSSLADPEEEVNTRKSK